RFTPADSGRAGSPVVYRAFAGERPVVSGGRPITMQRQGELWVAQLPEVAAGRWWFNQLFINGQRRTRARTPNEGYHQVAGYVGDKNHPQAKTAFRFAAGDLEPWPDLDQAMVTVYHSWETSLLPVKQADPEQRVVEFAGPAAWHFGYFGELPRYVVEGVRAALDAPGEWLLDRRGGELRYLPLPGEDPATAEVIAPVTTELLQLTGDTQVGLPVEHLAFEGISWQHADWSLEPTGHSDSQAVSTLGAAITVSGAVDCAFRNNELAHLGRYGIWFRTGSQRNEFRGNHLYDLGAGGVRVGETSLPPTAAAAVGQTVVDNNYLHDYGQVYAGGVGIYLGQTSDNQISHNEIHDGNYSGISVGWNWGSGPTAAHRNRIEFNHIHHVLRGVLSDGGGIYTLGSSPGTVIRGNYIHDIFSYSQPLIAWGIYLDAESNQITVTDNLVHHTTSGGLMMHNGAWANTVTNNIFAAGANQLIWRSPGTVQEPNRFERNVMGVLQGELFYHDARPD
ncbi:MAG: right-handed parallel beta-helix repeat-containing protein, partial [Armatimonadetes bacterium]|nr:right-handed parallel beta-helix repeat-containing protein [Armatimonadota bacterium]